MPLTDTRIRNAKPKPKPYKLSDGGGMYLLVSPDGGRYWRMDRELTPLLIGSSLTFYFILCPDEYEDLASWVRYLFTD